MYLAELFVENFRGFGAEKSQKHLVLQLSHGLNVLVGENDSGKSTIVDALRLVLSTRAQDSQRLTDDDFHVAGTERAQALTVRCTFADLTDAEVARFLEWLTFDGSKAKLIVTLRATRREPSSPRWRRIQTTVRTGTNADGPALEGDVRDFLQATYLRPLRDAEAELSAGRNSRLAAILEAHPEFKKHTMDDSKSGAPKTLLGIMRHAEQLIRESPLIAQTKQTLNNDYLNRLALGDQRLDGDMGVSREVELRHILEKLELWIAPDAPGSSRTRRGLGLNNLLFMAAELLLLGGDQESGMSLLLIEEPEAHLHPQLQMRLMEFLEAQAAEMKPDDSGKQVPGVQILVTTHSPNLASKVDIESLTLVAQRKCFHLGRESTKLDGSDYAFLRRFLDVTKANLFFARGVIVVEGDSENLLLPVLAAKLGRPFTRYGVSIVNVGSRALFRYARIFQRQDEELLPIHVACVSDLDVPPVEATYVERDPAKMPGPDATAVSAAALLDERAKLLRKRDGGVVCTFVSPQWTLEHDLALAGLAREVHAAIQIAKASRIKARKSGETLTAVERKAEAASANVSYDAIVTNANGNARVVAALVYEPLYRRQASKAETAEHLADLLARDTRPADAFRSLLPTYLRDAIDHVTFCAKEGTAK